MAQAKPVVQPEQRRQGTGDQPEIVELLVQDRHGKRWLEQELIQEKRRQTENEQRIL